MKQSKNVVTVVCCSPDADRLHGNHELLEVVPESTGLQHSCTAVLPLLSLAFSSACVLHGGVCPKPITAQTYCLNSALHFHLSARYLSPGAPLGPTVSRVYIFSNDAFLCPYSPLFGEPHYLIRPFVIVTQVPLVLIIKTSNFFLFLGLVNSFRFPHSILWHIHMVNEFLP